MPLPDQTGPKSQFWSLRYTFRGIGLTVNLGGTYIDSQILDSFVNYDALGILKQLAGEAFPLTPKWQVVGNAQYEFAINSSLDAFVGGA